MPSAAVQQPRAVRSARPRPDQVRFSDKLVLNGWMIAQFGVEALVKADARPPIRELAISLTATQEGLAADGLHYFYHAFNAALPAHAQVKAADLLRYEENIMAHTAALNAHRSQKISWKYFQWLTLLFVERYLDLYFSDRLALLDSLNAYVDRFNQWRGERGFVGSIEAFRLDELNKLCLQNATGSGKTLLMHINLMQFRHHAQQSGHLGDYSRALLLTPNEDLTAQHLRELIGNGIVAQRFMADLFATTGTGLSTVDALELTKLSETDGDKTIALRNFGDANLLLVDEGHVGLGSAEETGFIARRDALSSKGFVFEYSATFAQAVQAAKNEGMAQAYAKSVLFDYSYRYFYEDGYGKDYQVFNLADDRYDDGHTERQYLTACLLTVYQQLRVYDEQRLTMAAFNLEKPLWVFVGASVNKAIGGTQEEQATSTDVVRIVQFIAGFLYDQSQSTQDIAQVLQGGALLNAQNEDLFAHTFDYLRDIAEPAAHLLQDIQTRLFGGSGRLRLTRVSGDNAEIRLHTGDASKPFGLINVGDAPGLMTQLKACPHLLEEISQFANGQLFGSLNAAGSSIHLLIGSRKFISGWDCWRVSTLGLMNIGKSEGSQIIQLFGRGVRLKGKNWSLKRSSALPHSNPPQHISIVETLGVFGVKANYMQQFREALKEQGLEDRQQRVIPMHSVCDFGKQLMVLAPKTKDAEGRTYDFMRDGALPLLNAHGPAKLKQIKVLVDCYPRFDAIAGQQAQDPTGQKNQTKLSELHLAFVHWDEIWLALEQHRRLRGWTNLLIDRASLPFLFTPDHHGWYELLIPPSQLAINWKNIQLWQRVVLELLKRYVEAFYNYHKKAFFEPRLELQPLTADHANLVADEYRLSVESSQTQLLHDIEQLEQEINHSSAGIVPANPTAQIKAAITAPQLLKPLLHVGKNSRVTVSPVPLNDSEFEFVRDLNQFLQSVHARDLLNDAEVYLLRNKAKGGGIGFFEAGAFYPDFILWVLKDSKQYVAFVEPHGLRNERPDSPKLKFHKVIKEIETRVNQERSDKIVLHSFIISPTLMSDIRWGEDWQTVDAFAEQHVLMMKDDSQGYIAKLFSALI